MREGKTTATLLQESPSRPAAAAGSPETARAEAATARKIQKKRDIALLDKATKAITSARWRKEGFPLLSTAGEGVGGEEGGGWRRRENPRASASGDDYCV